MADREQTDVLHDVFRPVQEEDDTDEEQEVVVPGDHVFRAQIHQRTDGPAVESLEKHGVLARHAVCVEHDRTQRQHDEERRDQSRRSIAADTVHGSRRTSC